MILEKERFASLCRKYGSSDSCGLDCGFTTYNEKRLHKILKELVSWDVDFYEVPIGNYVADVFDGKVIYEIQTGKLYSLCKKLEYYLSQTEYPIVVIKPVIAKKRIIRADRGSGEIIRVRSSPKKADKAKLMEDIYGIATHLKNERLKIVVAYISVDEYRFSDEVRRYNKKGKYDSESFPRELLFSEEYCGARSYEFLLDGLPDAFCAADFALARGFSKRPLYSTLNLLCSLSLLEREKQGKKYVYKKTK